MVKDKPKLLDMYSGAGGAAFGYMKAGFHVTGVDNKSQKRYAGDAFIKTDAIEYALSHGWQYDAIHASPPCQAHSHITPDKSKHIDLIPQTRFVLNMLGLPYIIENVGGARKSLINPVMLCGADFGLKVYRHRFFESNVLLLVPCHVPHRDNTPRAGHGVSGKGFVSVTSGGTNLTVAGKEINAWQLEDMEVWKGRTERSRLSKPETYHRYISPKGYISVSGHFGAGDYVRFAMDIDWMTNAELAQAIPPAYTEYLGRQLMRHIEQSQTSCEHLFE